jgi:hypothetical protein
MPSSVGASQKKARFTPDLGHYIFDLLKNRALFQKNVCSSLKFAVFLLYLLLVPKFRPAHKLC